ncbi:MAG: hypothetical protein IJY58_02970 [Alphaproteobacteria bacterium]|nr:hypothetical protein [Alphaproteobacteria bacterium]
MPQFDLQWFSSEAFWMLLCFGVLYVIVTYFIFPLFQDVFQERDYKIKNDLTIAEMVNQQADKLVQDYKNRIYAAQETKAAIVNETYRDIQKFATHVEAEHEEKLRRQIEETEQKMHRIQEDVIKQSETVAVQVARELSAKLSASFKSAKK